MANRSEALTYEDVDPFIPVAKCWQEDDYSTLIKGVSVLIMEKIKIINNMSYDELPDWAGYVDCAQVGYNKEGQLVAYDL